MFINQWRGRADRLRVGTQISNIPAIRLYESLGFRHLSPDRIVPSPYSRSDVQMELYL
jgi:ribosomal protein S18 acetylase RimI-like enzyme